MNSYKMPDTFLWGAATAGHQVEGNNVNSESWILEHLPGTIYAEPSGDACDHYHRYQDDIRLLASLGFNAYRFSIEWARVEPEEGEFSQAALDHYRDVLETCRRYALSPIVTLHHFTSPAWFMRKGGWLSDQAPNLYARYVERVAPVVGPLAGAVATFNEPNIARVLDIILPFKINQGAFWEGAAAAFGVDPADLGLFQFVSSGRMWDVVHGAHLEARSRIKALFPKLPVGLTLAMHDFQALSGGEAKKAELQRYVVGEFLDRLGDDDFVGVQTYSRLLVGPEGPAQPPLGAELNQSGEEFYPEAIGGTVRYVWNAIRVPVLVTENGVASEDDTRRVEYYRRATRSVAQAMADGVDVRAYFAWSAMDNFEWVSGYTPKFGLIAVDRKTFERTVKPSGHFLGSLARSGTVTWE